MSDVKPQALFYAPSFLRIENQIREIAPDLDVVLLDEQGKLNHKGKEVSLDDCQPTWFWFHGEIFGNKERTRQYFDIILNSPSASWLHTVNTGLDGLPYLDVFQKGVTISNNHSQAIAISEYVLGQVMAYYQKHAVMKAQQQQHQWQYTRFKELATTRWLIIGFGHIGKEIAKRIKPFGVSVDVVRRKPDGEGLADNVYSQEQLPEVLSQADVVVLTCASNDHTRDMVDASFLKDMKEESVLINIARGDLVVEEDLHEALDQGKPALAVLDVFREEPVKTESWFWDHPNVVLTPHCSNAGSGMGQRSTTLFLDNLSRMVSGEPLANVVTESDFI